MNPIIIFNVQVFLSLIIFAVVAKKYVWPALKEKNLKGALIPLLLFSSFRFVGLNFLIPFLNNNLPSAFAVPAGYGDFIAGLIALVAALFLVMGSGTGVFFAWVYAIFGSLDFVYALYLINVNQVPLYIGSNWWFMTIVGPATMVALVLIFCVLIKNRR